MYIRKIRNRVTVMTTHVNGARVEMIERDFRISLIVEILNIMVVEILNKRKIKYIYLFSVSAMIAYNHVLACTEQVIISETSPFQENKGLVGLKLLIFPGFPMVV